jgi:hypothetical protein
MLYNGKQDKPHYKRRWTWMLYKGKQKMNCLG